MASTKPYKLLAQVFHQGKVHRPGDVLEFDDETARKLMTPKPVILIPLAGIVKAASAGKPDSGASTSTALGEGSPEGPSQGDSALTLLQVIAELPKDEASLFTSSGAPKADVLSEQLGRNVSAAERDAAWTEYQAQHA